MKQEESAVFVVLIPITSSHVPRLRVAKRSVIWLKTRLTNAEQRFRITVFNIAAYSTVHGNEQYRSKVFRYSPIVLSSVPEHDIVSQVTALQKEHTCDLSDAFQLSTTMHSLQLCRANSLGLGWVAQGPPTIAPLALQGLHGRLLRPCVKSRMLIKCIH